MVLWLAKKEGWEGRKIRVRQERSLAEQTSNMNASLKAGR